MNNSTFAHHFQSQPTSFFDSLLSLEKFIDKKHAFDDFAHLVFKAPQFEDLISVVSVYTSAFGPMTDREVAMVQKRMYQLNRQTVRAMHEIINQKQLIAGINSKEINFLPGMLKTPPSNSSFNMATPLPSSGMYGSTSPMMPRSQQQYGGYNHHANDIPTTILNTPVQTPTGPDRFMKPSSSSVGKTLDCSFNDRQSSMTVQDLLRIQQNWANSLLNSAGSHKMNDSLSMPTPSTPGSAMMDNNLGANFFGMTPPTPTSIFSAIGADSSLIYGGANAVFDDSKLRNNGRMTTTRRRLRSETALLDM